jgi:nucleoid DNA-binding protein
VRGREHEFVAEPISMFSKISLTKLGSLGDREKVREQGKNPKT